MMSLFAVIKVLSAIIPKPKHRIIFCDDPEVIHTTILITTNKQRRSGYKRSGEKGSSCIFT
jgi:hypothetical protein